ncbi:MAG: CDP-glucose 4,6-dehydratase [Prosthecobacter sp.]|uniref:CDP-glucose 4,6-dehydratase n=1 Tax=Prosthecobacter sp. TaxID=1965333 RepID=UPI003BAE1C46
MGRRHSTVESLVMFGGIYKNRRILITGHTGFKGAWLGQWLHRLGAEVHGLALPPDTDAGVYATACHGIFSSESAVDIRDAAATAKAVLQIAPEFVFHLAAQSLVRRAYREPLETTATNVMGTAHVLNALRSLPSPPKAVVVVTSDKCYENVGRQQSYQETDPMGGHDPYSASKGATEIIASAWRRSFFNGPESVRLATARGGNVIGGGDWAEDRIIPDCIRALRAGTEIPLRNPTATRPWQHVLDCLSGYLCLGARLASAPVGSVFCSGFNFGPSLASVRSVRDLMEEVMLHWPGRWKDISEGQGPHEAQFLQLAIERAATELGWTPVWDFATAVRHTVEWYRHQNEGTALMEITAGQISAYEQDAMRSGAAWAAFA